VESSCLTRKIFKSHTEASQWKRPLCYTVRWRATMSEIFFWIAFVGGALLCIYWKRRKIASEAARYADGDQFPSSPR
jgi:hypothetical protein